MLKNRLVEKKYASARSGSSDLYQLWCNENPKKLCNHTHFTLEPFLKTTLFKTNQKYQNQVGLIMHFGPNYLKTSLSSSVSTSCLTLSNMFIQDLCQFQQSPQEFKRP